MESHVAVRRSQSGEGTRLAGAIVLIVTLLAAVPAARGGVNLTGSWYVQGADFPPVLVEVTQAGTSLEFAGVPGTIDSATGAFIARVTGPGPCDFQSYTGTAAPDGNTMTGLFEFGRPHPILGTCTGGGFTFAGSRAPCGNGMLDPGETCDDGTPGTGVCCQLGCVDGAPAGTPCESDGQGCTADACDAAGACTHPVATAGTVCRPVFEPCDVDEVCDGSAPACPPDLPADSDDDGLRDPCDACPGGASIGDPRVKVSKYDDVPGNDAFSVSGIMHMPAALAASIDPVARGLRAQIMVPFRTLLLDVVLPPGAYDPETRTGWRMARSGLTWKFRSKDPSVLARQARVRISEDDPAEVQVKLTGKRLSFAAGNPPLSARLTLALDPPAATGELCGDALAGSCELSKTASTCR